MRPQVLKAVAALVKQQEPSVINKLVEKLAGQDSINVKLQVERELEEAMERMRERLPEATYEQIVNILASDLG